MGLLQPLRGFAEENGQHVSTFAKERFFRISLFFDIVVGIPI